MTIAAQRVGCQPVGSPGDPENPLILDRMNDWTLDRFTALNADIIRNRNGS